MSYTAFVGLREDCGYCQEMRRRLPLVREVAALTGFEVVEADARDVPAEVKRWYPGVPVLYFRDPNGRLLLSKTLVGLQLPGDQGTAGGRFSRLLARWFLGTRSNDI